MTRDEVLELGLLEEHACCVRHGISFVQFSVVDRGVPDPTEFAELIGQTCNDLISGINVAIHCRVGIGRSGMLASCVLKHFGMTANEAVSVVSAARGVTVPDTDEQLELIQMYVPRH